MTEITYKLGLKCPRIVLKIVAHLVIEGPENIKLTLSDLMGLDRCVSLQPTCRNLHIFKWPCSDVGNCSRPFKINKMTRYT